MTVASRRLVKSGAPWLVSRDLVLPSVRPAWKRPTREGTFYKMLLEREVALIQVLLHVTFV